MTTATMDEMTAEFLLFLKQDKRASANTIDAYKRGLTHFGYYLNRIGFGGIPTGWSRVTPEVFRAYLLNLDKRRPKGKPMAQSTKSQRFSAVRAFFRFLVTEGHVKSDPTEGIASPRVPKTLPKPLDERQLENLLEQPAKIDTPQALRDQAMMELLYATGLRNTELVSLNLVDVLFDKRGSTIHCIGKDHKERALPIEGMAEKILASYIEAARPELVRRNKNETALFVNHHGKRITRQSFWLILKEYARMARIEWLVTPTVLRHSFAVCQLINRVPMKDVQKAMGHANVSTTQVYAEIVGENTRAVYENAHPRAK